MVDTERVDRPISFLKGTRGILHESVARVPMLRCAVAVTPSISCPGAAKCHVKSDLVVAEVLVDVAIALKEGCRSSPAAWVWCVPKRVTGSGAAGPEEYLDVVARPLHRVNATAVAVEAGAVAIVGCCTEATTFVG